MKVHVNVKMGLVQMYVCCLLFVVTRWSPSFGEDTGERNGALPSANLTRLHFVMVPLVVFTRTPQRSEMTSLCAVAV